ncbi:type VII secretion protein EssC, partial [Enterococcus lactis]|uniref:FtsK/SpoIIIE domain-containing protein n=1 Tax=Enterococcus lactis TaxID=357441 RepID=UPI00217DDC78
QGEVKKIKELLIRTRGMKVDTNKSIRSLIGWRGKSEYVYWELHERGHGPHALVGGTTGSGKSEFLTTYLLGLAINLSPEDIDMLVIARNGVAIENRLENLHRLMGAITNIDDEVTTCVWASNNAE